MTKVLKFFMRREDAVYWAVERGGKAWVRAAGQPTFEEMRKQFEAGEFNHFAVLLNAFVATGWSINGSGVSIEFSDDCPPRRHPMMMQAEGRISRMSPQQAEAMLTKLDTAFKERTIDKDEVYTAGHRAFGMGFTIDHNPFNVETNDVMHDAWQDGWIHASQGK